MAKKRVYELAKELGVESKSVMEMLAEMGEFVRSASTPVEPPVVRRLREQLAPGGARRPRGTIVGPEVKAAAAAAGKRPFLPTPRRAAAPQGRRRVEQDPYKMAWAKLWFDQAARAAWVDAGLGQHQASVAQQCCEAGLKPADLATRVDGSRIVERLRGGETVASVVARLRPTWTAER